MILNQSKVTFEKNILAKNDEKILQKIITIALMRKLNTVHLSGVLNLLQQ